MTIKQIYEKAEFDLDRNKITIGEFAKIIGQEVVIIPDNVTNGDMIMALFDVKEVRKYRTRATAWLSSVNPIDFQLNWWNAPYKKGESNEKDKTDN